MREVTRQEIATGQMDITKMSAAEIIWRAQMLAAKEAKKAARKATKKK